MKTNCENCVHPEDNNNECSSVCATMAFEVSEINGKCTFDAGVITYGQIEFNTQLLKMFGVELGAPVVCGDISMGKVSAIKFDKNKIYVTMEFPK